MIRFAKNEDIEQILTVLDDAITRFKIAGIDQWQNGYPNREVFMNDINNGRLFVILKDELIVGFSAFYKEDEVSYKDIDTWDYENSAVIHRIAISGKALGVGLASEFMNYFVSYAKENNYDSIKIDTHKENCAMLALINKFKFEYKGYLPSIDRVAFELALKEVK